MDPYLEAHWGDVHARLITYAADQLQSRLPADLRARVEERVYLESEDGAQRSYYPDVRVVERPYQAARSQAEEGGVAVAELAAEPLVVHVAEEPVTEGFIEIREVGSGHRVVTTIEFVSLANKRRGPGRELYLRKRNEFQAGEVNTVEIDLLREGENVVAVPPDRVPPEYRTTYRVCVWRATRPLAYEVYRVPLEERLPRIRIPLRATDKDAVLDLQTLIDQCYQNGGYNDLDYTAELNPPLTPRDAQWTSELLKSRGLKSSRA